jgi:hypothetical protein
VEPAQHERPRRRGESKSASGVGLHGRPTEVRLLGAGAAMQRRTLPNPPFADKRIGSDRQALRWQKHL